MHHNLVTTKLKHTTLTHGTASIHCIWSTTSRFFFFRKEKGVRACVELEAIVEVVILEVCGGHITFKVNRFGKAMQQDVTRDEEKIIMKL